MAKKECKASLSKGRNSWCVIFRHPLCKAADGKQQLRVRRGLGTSDENEALRLIGQLNEILADESLWKISAKESLSNKYDGRIISAFFDHVNPEKYDPWGDRENCLPLPDKSNGYVRVQFVGTTGAGKTTLLRQIIGTDPKTERFPSISAAKTTTCDIEIIIKDSELYEAAVSFIPKERVRQYIAECVINAIFSKMDNNSDAEVYRRLLEHNEQHFRLSYLLGSPHTLKRSDPAETIEDYEDEEETLPEQDLSLIDDSERKKLLEKLEAYFSIVLQLSAQAKSYFNERAIELGIPMENATPADKEVIYEFVEDDIYNNEAFHELVDDILEEVEAKCDIFETGNFEKTNTGWPVLWKYRDAERKNFIKSVNQFSSNYAPNFGRLLTPLVDGIRVAGPFKPSWNNESSNGELPKLVLLDGRGIGHTADSTASLSTSITKHFKTVDCILLVDNAAQPMQAAPCAVLRTIVSSGHESKLVLALTHFDEVRGDNLVNTQFKKDHVRSSIDNAIHAISKDFGREAEIGLRNIADGNVFFFSNIQKELKEKAKFTLDQLEKFICAIFSKIAPEEPSQYYPVYDVANLVFAIQKATQEFHDRWHGILGMGSLSPVIPSHWATIKALTRRLGIFRMDEYGGLQPVADLINLLQVKISVYLNNPLEWHPHAPSDNQLKIQVIDKIRKELHNRLHELSSRRILEEQVNEWIKAYEHRGSGSTRIRSRDMISIYETAAPIPNEMPDADTNAFLFELRELVAIAIQETGGKLRGWTRDDK